MIHGLRESFRSTYGTPVFAYEEGLLTPLLMQPYATGGFAYVPRYPNRVLTVLTLGLRRIFRSPYATTVFAYADRAKGLTEWLMCLPNRTPLLERSLSRSPSRRSNVRTAMCHDRCESKPVDIVKVVFPCRVVRIAYPQTQRFLRFK